MSASKDDQHLADEDGDDYLYNDDDTGDYDGDDDDDELVVGNDDDDEAIGLEENETDNLPRLYDNYTVLQEADIRQRLEDNIAEVSAVLSISKVEASILLLHYNWSVHKVPDAWFADENEARKKAGLLLKPLIELPDHGDNNVLCGICFESYPRDGVQSTTCGHPYCNDCWSRYIKTAIVDGPGSLLLKCPEPSCCAAVGEDMIGLFASEEEKDKYWGYFIKSYVEENKMIKWCPAPGCGNAVQFVAGGENSDVSCSCSHSFCWNCTQEAHRPLDCETVRKWMLKHSSEAENVNYILAFTKPCPKCKKPIEKNMGCSHMTCRPPCSYEFCWLCLGDYKTHVGSCNSYQEKTGDDEKRREKAKKYISRYTHYFERWATNKKSMKKAAADLQIVQSKQIEILGRYQCQPEAQLNFLTEAWKQIVECRKVLTWTYAYGYYLPDEDPAKRNLFEYLQGQAEFGLERLHDCAEKELIPFLKDERLEKEFIEFRKRLTGLTRVTRNYFENLVAALENGLSDVNSLDSSTVSKKPKLGPTIDYVEAAAENYSVDTIKQPWICSYCTYQNYTCSTYCAMCRRGGWACDHCTYANLRSAITCAMCSKPRLS